MRDFKRFKEGTQERNLFLPQSQNIFIFSVYTDVYKIVVALKRPLILILYVLLVHFLVYLLTLFIIKPLPVGFMFIFCCNVNATSGIVPCTTPINHDPLQYDFLAQSVKQPESCDLGLKR